MTPKEKAFELKYKYSKLLDLKSTDELVLKCALSAVDEIRRLMNRLQNYEQAVYWKEVKHEIQKI
jgi:hypothetical protein